MSNRTMSLKHIISPTSFFHDLKGISVDFPLRSPFQCSTHIEISTSGVVFLEEDEFNGTAQPANMNVYYSPLRLSLGQQQILRVSM